MASEIVITANAIMSIAGHNGGYAMSKQKRPRPKLVSIWWVDACTDSQAQHDYNPEKIAKECGLYENRETSGYLIWSDEVKTILAHDWDASENQVGNMTVVPTPWIRRRRGFPKPPKEKDDVPIRTETT